MRFAGIVALMAWHVCGPLATGERITSTCRITAVNAAKRTVTLVRKTSSGEKTGVAKVADKVDIQVGGENATLDSLQVPIDASIVFDSELHAVVGIKVAGTPSAAGSEPPRAIAPFDAKKAKEYQEAWARHLGVPVETTNSVGMKLVLIPPGEFGMGADAARKVEGTPEDKWMAQQIAKDAPCHRVSMTKPLRMAATETTVGQFRQFVEASHCVTDGEKPGNEGWTFFVKDKPPRFELQPGRSWKKPVVEQTDSHPVVYVTWNDAIAFCGWLSQKEGKTYRLPSEAEWEFACRGGTSSAYWTGDDPQSLRGAANVQDRSLERLTGLKSWAQWDDGASCSSPVGAFKPSPFGLYDMHGNVWEWCRDWFDAGYYRQSPKADPSGPFTGSARVIRGACWHDPYALWLSSANRNKASPTDLFCNTGFRVVCVIDAKGKQD